MPIATITPRAAAALTAAAPSKYGSLAMPQRMVATTATAATTTAVRPCRRSRQPSTATVATSTSHEFESLGLHEVAELAPTTLCQRSVSCFEFGSDARRFRTLRLGSDELQCLARANVAELTRTATSTAAQDATNGFLARKALCYRKISCASDGITSASASPADC